MRLWIDDERPMPTQYTHHALGSSAAIGFLARYRDGLSVISFDHDLGGDDTSRPVMLFMIENGIWPDTLRFHTANPVGREWIVGMAERYAPAETYVDRMNPHAIKGFENYG
jgi:hypothetical protein